MKRLLFAILFFCSMAFISHAQITPPSEGKAVVYFVRVSALGMVIPFTYLDSNVVIGKFNSPNYIRYECDPGKHLFWARSENDDFITAEVEAGKIYFVEVVPSLGMLYAKVFLRPVDSKESDRMEKIEKVINKFAPQKLSEEELRKEQKHQDLTIQKAFESYKRELDKGKKKFKRLEKTMFYEKAGEAANK